MRLIARSAQSWALEKGCSRLGAKPASLDFSQASDLVVHCTSLLQKWVHLSILAL